MSYTIENILEITICLSIVLVVIPHVYAQGSPGNIISENNTKSVASNTGNFKTYENSTYGIVSVIYPNDWAIYKPSSKGNNIVEFYGPANASLAATFDIAVDNPHNTTGNLARYLNYTISNHIQGDPDFRLIRYGTNATLSGNPAYLLEYRDRSGESDYRVLELGTMVSGDKVIHIDYSGDTTTFSKFLPIALKMIDSLKINESIITRPVIHPLYAQTANETSTGGSPMQQVQNNGIAAPTSKTDVVSKIVGLCNQYQALCGTPICSSVAPSTGIDTASCMKALPAVRTFFNSHSTSPSPQSQPATASSIKTYHNSTYGITSLQYPSDWTINETNSRSAGSSIVDIVTFYPPTNSYPSTQHAPYVRLLLSQPPDNNVVRSLSDYLSYALESFSNGDPTYTTINSNTTARLGGFPAYSIEFSNTTDNSPYRELQLGTIISGGKLLITDYVADTPSFSTLLPTALKMISSLRINAPAIAKLTPSSSPSPPLNNATTNSPATTTPTYTKTHRSETISSGSFSLPPGGMFKDFTITVPSNAVNARLTGSYSVSGGILSLINVYLLDAAGSYMINEVSPSGTVVKILSPGTYTLEFKNEAVFAGETKNVEADFNLDYDLLTPSP